MEEAITSTVTNLNYAILKRDETKAHLRVRDEQLRTMAFLVESAASPIVMTSLDGKLTHVNPAFLRTWGYEREEEVLGRPVVDFWMMHERLDYIMNTLQSEGRIFEESQAKKCDGTLFDVQVSAAIVLDDKKQPIALMSSSLDITEQKQVAKELQNYRDHLEESVNERTHQLEAGK